MEIPGSSREPVRRPDRGPLLLALVGVLLAGSLSADGEEMFLGAGDPTEAWERTLSTVSAEWPVVRAVAPDPEASPPGEGVIETAWIEPPGRTGETWPPTRQRVVVRVVPTTAGAWIDAAVETESFAPAAGVTAAGWQAASAPDAFTGTLVSRLAPGVDPVVQLPPADELAGIPAREELPWARSRFPRLARAGIKVVEDYRNFYDCESLVCLTAAFGAGAIMANTGFDTTMQTAWQEGVTPTSVGTFFSGCKDIGEGRYALSVFGAAAATGLVFEGHPAGDAVGEWGSRSLRMFVVGAPPVYVLQWATGASRPGESSAGSDWKFFDDNNGVSGHAFVGAIPFLAAADMVDSPLLKGTLYVCSTFVAFSRITDDAHYPSQAFLGWYLALASARAIDATEMRFAGLEVSVMPLPIGDLGGMAVQTRW
ncbi:MAG TPA: hypothetical protein DC048_11385 [Planctomycetaceae bacterium]|nr:hypothetical protein [Planctomycetaceae bacterium]